MPGITIQPSRLVHQFIRFVAAIILLVALINETDFLFFTTIFAALFSAVLVWRYMLGASRSIHLLWFFVFVFFFFGFIFQIYCDTVSDPPLIIHPIIHRATLIAFAACAIFAPSASSAPSA